jgi:hypothetical protein
MWYNAISKGIENKNDSVPVNPFAYTTQPSFSDRRADLNIETFFIVLKLQTYPK